MTFGLVHANYSFPKWQAVKLTSFYTLPESVQELWLVDLVNFIQSTPNNSSFLEKSKKVWVIRSLKQISIKVRECKYHALSQWTLNMNWSDKKGKERNWHSCFEINSVFWTSVQWYTVFFLTCQVFKTCFELSRVKLCTIVPEKKGIYHLPSIPCACLGVIASGLRDENMNFT